MSFMRPLFLRLQNLNTIGVGALLLLMFGAAVKACFLTFLDIGVIGAYLANFDRVYLAFDLMCAAVFIAAAGYYALLFDRRQGYGCIPVLSLCGIFFIGLIFAAHENHLWALRFLFITKYGFFALLTASFWAVVSRFIPIRLDSIKLLSVLVAQLLGYFAAGAISALFIKAPLVSLTVGVFLFLAFLIVLKILVDLNPVPSETFIQKQGGAQDAPGQKLVYYIFGLSFAYMCAKSATDYTFLSSLIDKNVPYLLGIWWGVFGMLGILLVILLYQTKYLYTTVLGMLVLASSLVMTAVGVFCTWWEVIFAGALMFSLASYFYINAFLSLLPRPIAIGAKSRIKKKRFLVAEPLGFAFGAIILYYFETPFAQGMLLLSISAALFLLIHLAVDLYSNILLDSFKRRQWRGGPLMIALPKLYHYILNGLKSVDADQAIYFIRILAISKHASYPKNLLKLIKHPSPIVREFTLGRMAMLKQPAYFKKTISWVAQKDPSAQVRCLAVSMLMQFDYEQDLSNGLDKYMPMLNDKKLKPGVLLGLLKLGGDQALLAMKDLQKLAFSKKKADQLSALKIIEQAPLSGLALLVEPLMKSSDVDVARQALLTAGAMRHPQLLPPVFEALDDVRTQEYALIAIDRYGKRAFPPLEKMLHNPDVPRVRQKVLILFLNSLNSGEGKQILIRALNVPDQKLRRIVMNCLINSGIIWIHADKKALLLAGLNKDIDRVHKSLDFIQTQTISPTHETEEAFLFLRRALQEDIFETRKLILLQLQLLKPHPLFSKAIRILLSDRRDQYDAALGVVQDFLPAKLYKKIKPIVLLSDADVKPHGATRVILEEQAVENLSAFLLKPPFVLPPWIKATLLYTLRKLGYEEGKSAVLAALKDTNSLVLEAAIWALVRLEKDSGELHRALLNVPTSRLVGQSIEEILES